MQLYQKRSFGEYFSDTFKFIRLHGKHFYKNYLLINGIFILILMTLYYFFGKFYTDFLTASINPQGGGNIVEEYINDHMWAVMGFFGLFFVVGIIAATVNYAFTPIYLNRFSENNTTDFNSNTIWGLYKQHLGKLVVFILAGLLIAIPTIIALGLASALVMITIIGFPLVFVVLGFGSLFYHSTLMEYLRGRKGIFDAFQYGLNLPFKKFWAACGSVGLFYLMVTFVQYFVSMLPYFIFGFSVFVDAQSTSQNPDEAFSSMMVAMIASMMLSYLVSILLNTVVQINQGIIYFSIKEELENINTQSTIDQIGANA